MSSEERDKLAAALASAEADLDRLRKENTALAQAFRAEPSDDKKEELRRAAASLSGARDRIEAARAALAVFDRTGTPHGLVAEDGRVFGTVALVIPPGCTRADREKAISQALGDALSAAASELSVVLGASPEKYTRERPGRDDEGRTVLDVAGRVEGDVLMPAVSHAAKKAR
jgi:hypothetical protein